MAQLVKVNINIEGHTIKNLHSVRVSQYLHTHHQFEIVVPFEEFENKDAIFFQQAHRQLCGKSISIQFEPRFTKFSKGNGSQFQFKGIVTEVTLESNSELDNSFIIRGFSPTYLLEDGVQRRAFSGISLNKLFGFVLSPYSSNLLGRKLALRYEMSLNYKAQYDESNYEFLSRLAAEYGEWFYYDGQQLIAGAPDNNVVDFWIDGIQNFSMAISVKPAKFQMYHYNYGKNREFANSSAVQSIQMGDFVRFAHDESEKLFRQESHLGSFRDIRAPGELDSTAKNIKAVNASDMVVFKGTGETPTLNLGAIINVKGQKLEADYKRDRVEDFGQYRLTEITHTVDSEGNYENHFKAVPNSSSHPPHNTQVRVPVAQPELATVYKNKDPDSLGRVLVQFMWGNRLEAFSSWMRVSQPYTGGPKGMLWIPEVDDQLVIGYELNNPDLPFVMGSVYQKDEKVGAKYTNDENYQKIIRTKGGNKMVFKDKGGEQEVYITNSNKKGTNIHLSFKGDGTITIKTEGDINIEAGKNITMKAGKNISIESQSGEITVEAKSKNIKLSAMQNVEAKANKDFKATATANAEMSANVKAEVKGAVSAKLSGAKTDVEGQALVSVQAPLVKIN